MKPEFTGCWPYGKWGPLPAVWHPMYMGQIYAQLGLYIVPEFRQMFPALVPVHVFFFVLCIIQELYDIHEGKPQPKPAYKEGEDFKLVKGVSEMMNKARRRVVA